MLSTKLSQEDPMPLMIRQPQRCASLWFGDATFIFQAESTLFRVYGGMLSARSSVFADIISTRPGDDLMIDGCNLVYLPDSAAEVECFFQAIFNSKYVFRLTGRSCN